MLQLIPTRPLIDLATVLTAVAVAGLVARTVSRPSTLVIRVGASPARPADRSAP